MSVSFVQLVFREVEALNPFAQIRYDVKDLVGELAPELVCGIAERGSVNRLPVFVEDSTVPAHTMRKMLLGTALRFGLGPPLSIEEQKPPEILLLNTPEAYGRTCGRWAGELGSAKQERMLDALRHTLDGHMRPRGSEQLFSELDEEPD